MIHELRHIMSPDGRVSLRCSKLHIQLPTQCYSRVYRRQLAMLTMMMYRSPPVHRRATAHNRIWLLLGQHEAQQIQDGRYTRTISSVSPQLLPRTWHHYCLQPTPTRPTSHPHSPTLTGQGSPANRGSPASSQIKPTKPCPWSKSTGIAKRHSLGQNRAQHSRMGGGPRAGGVNT
ncbi:hypothetical protein AC579_9097 [Pseudocercospora musae]|uniref:Uncharacterized protein n=1 Tax=Pseudocercospora musae TaxID=113226 RepID=A0A139IIK2_9PEZI|nr:hypothetical protein AC579_9097 [Pseudocercospora musae]